MKVTGLLSVAGLALAVSLTPALSASGAAQSKAQGSRQYRGEPKGNKADRDTRCRIVVQKGQDRRVCGKPTNYAPQKKPGSR